MDHALIATVVLASWIAAAAPPAHLRALAPDAFDAPRADRIPAPAPLPAAPEGALPDLQWPLQAAPGFDAFGYHGTGYFVDHDARFPGFLQDYTCGVRTYDLDGGYNHAGTDYYLWPYPWLMMDSEQVQIVAAAPGVVAGKIDGNFDRDCAIAGDGGFNAVFVRQDDGLMASYLHMKNGSQTTKAVGERVAAGEFLGLVGSSGPSSLPHLHFELRDAADHVVDPLRGACNDAPDRWIMPQPYESPRIDTLTTHSAEPAFVDCGVENGIPVHEDPHFADAFAPGATLWAFASYSDHRIGAVTLFRVLRPDASVETSWEFDLASENLPKPFYSGTAWDWSVTLPADAPSGTWTLEAEFEGRTYRHAFVVTESPTRGHSRHARPARDPQPIR